MTNDGAETSKGIRKSPRKLCPCRLRLRKRIVQRAGGELRQGSASRCLKSGEEGCSLARFLVP